MLSVTATRLETEWITREAMASLGPAWADLAERAIEPNPFLSPLIGMARLRHRPDGRRVRILAVWRNAGGLRRLVGLWLISPARGRHLNPCGLWRVDDPYGPLSTPLLDPEAPEETLAAMLDALAQAGIAALALPHLVADGPMARALRHVTAHDGRAVVSLGTEGRAALRSTLSAEDYIAATVERRRRKEAERQRRRLAEQGTLTVTEARSEDEVGAALERFLALEAAGWKGRRATAIARSPGAAAYFREVAQAGARAGSFRIVELTLNGQPIASGLVTVAGHRAFYLKTAYDEHFGRYSPGLLLTLDITTILLADETVDDADSLAVASHPMIDRIWAARFRMTSLLVATRPGRSLAFRAAHAVEILRERTVEVLKALRAR